MARDTHKAAPAPRIAVMDLGSNTARLAVMERRAGVMVTVAGDREPLKLMRAVGADGRLSAQTVADLEAVVRRFATVARDAGAQTVMAVATSAIRDSANGPEVLEQLRTATGVDIRLIDADSEARFSFDGAISGLPVANGVVLDVGGGSIEIIRFRDRELVESWTLPLGALRTSDAYLLSDPPQPGEVLSLVAHVGAILAGAGVTPLRDGEVLVGTGGTIRNSASALAAAAEARDRAGGAHPGSVEADSVAALALELAAQSMKTRAKVHGISSDRADSIAGGALVVATVMAWLRAPEMTVSGGGLREGVALALLAQQDLAARGTRRTRPAATLS